MTGENNNVRNRPMLSNETFSHHHAPNPRERSYLRICSARDFSTRVLAVGEAGCRCTCCTLTSAACRMIRSPRVSVDMPGEAVALHFFPGPVRRQISRVSTDYGPSFIHQLHECALLVGPAARRSRRVGIQARQKVPHFPVNLLPGKSVHRRLSAFRFRRGNPCSRFKLIC